MNLLVIVTGKYDCIKQDWIEMTSELSKIMVYGSNTSTKQNRTKMMISKLIQQLKLD
jgi:hypothetical protein